MSCGHFATHFFLVVPRPMTFGHLELAKTKCKQMLESKLRKLKFEQKCLVFFVFFLWFPMFPRWAKHSLKIHQTK